MLESASRLFCQLHTGQISLQLSHFPDEPDHSISLIFIPAIRDSFSQCTLSFQALLPFFLRMVKLKVQKL